jgi:hypothetical protein
MKMFSFFIAKKAIYLKLLKEMQKKFIFSKNKILNYEIQFCYFYSSHLVYFTGSF